MIYKYLFYSVSYVIKKYDRWWNVGEMYFIGGGMIVGMTIATTVFVCINVFEILLQRNLLHNMKYFLSLFPLLLGLFVTICLGINNRHERIYNEVRNMNLQKKKKYKVLNILHLILIWGLFFSFGKIIRDMLGNG